MLGKLCSVHLKKFEYAVGYSAPKTINNSYGLFFENRLLAIYFYGLLIVILIFYQTIINQVSTGTIYAQIKKYINK